MIGGEGEGVRVGRWRGWELWRGDEGQGVGREEGGSERAKREGGRAEGWREGRGMEGGNRVGGRKEEWREERGMEGGTKDGGKEDGWRGEEGQREGGPRRVVIVWARCHARIPCPCCLVVVSCVSVACCCPMCLGRGRRVGWWCCLRVVMV